MKKEMDPGLKYVKQLGIVPEKNGKAVYEKILACCDEEQALALDKALADRDAEAVYRLKNASYDMAMAFSGSYDAGIVRQAVNYIEKHKSFFGKEILEVGCDIGFMTCYLAQAFPESHITAIDRGAEGIEIARKLAEKFGLTNITFRNVELNDLGDESFDTVFSMRTIQENRKEGLDVPDFKLLSEKLETYFIPIVEDYAKEIGRHVRVDGHVVTIERTGIDPLLLGWMFSLTDAACRMNPDTFETLRCEEMGEEVQLQAFIALRKEKAEQEDGDYLYMFWCGLFTATSNSSFTGWMAEMMLQNYIEELVEGYYFTNDKGQVFMKSAIYTVHGMPNSIMVFQSNYEMTKLDFFTSDMLPQVKKEIKNLMKYMDANRMEARPLEYKNGVEKAVSSLILPKSVVQGKEIILP